MKKTIKYKNGLIIIEFNENLEVVVLPEEEHSITLSVFEMLNDQMRRGNKIWDEKRISIEEGNELEEIESWINTAEEMGKRFIDVNYQQDGSPIRQILVSKGFND